eukprot:COSAG06_NODE_51730_length_310_cov_0.843602_1_plen_65_part_10
MQDSKQGPFGPTIGGCTHAEAVAAWVAKQGVQHANVNAKGAQDCELIAIDSSDDFATLITDKCNT